MTTFYDVPANFLIPALAEQLKSNASISMPEWADVVKTGSSRERPPTQTDWWHTRGAAILRKIARQGPIGVTALSQEFGGRKNNGSKPNTPGVGSRKVIRILIQQLEDMGVILQDIVIAIEKGDGRERLNREKPHWPIRSLARIDIIDGKVEIVG